MQQRVIQADSDPRLHGNYLQMQGFSGVLGRSFTGFFTCLAARSENCHCSAIARPKLAYARDAGPETLITMSESMKQTFGLIRRPWGTFYLKNKATGVQKSLKTRDKFEAARLLVASNEAGQQRPWRPSGRPSHVAHGKTWSELSQSGHPIYHFGCI